MSDAFFIGTALNGKHRGYEGEQMEAVNTRLQGIPMEWTQIRLLDRLHSTALDYSVASMSSSSDRMAMIMEHVVSSMAQEQLDIHRGRRSPRLFSKLGWLPIAKSSLYAQAAENGLTSEWLSGAIFFAEDKAKIFTQLSRAVLARLEPFGAYTRYTFAAGVASGAIELNKDNLGEPDNNSSPTSD
jgi:hypothetical protein